MGDELGHKAATGAVWATVDKFGYMSIQFAVNLILARMLLPKDFGVIGILSIFIAVSQTLIDGGFGSALIQKKNPTKIDYSTIFYWNLCFSIFLYFVLFFASPYISKFFNMPLLCEVLRVIALSLIITGILSIQKTRLQKQLAFKTIAIVNLLSYIIGALCAVVMARNGLGVWCLVFMQIIYGCCSVLLLGIITRWMPSPIFSKDSIKELFGFGGYIMAANILQTICQNIQGLIIGKKFSATQMGYFSQAYKLDQVTSYSIPQVIVQVMYPVYSSLQDNRERLNQMVLMNMRVVAFIIFPILANLILIAEPLLIFLYGEKWLSSAPYFRILCIGGFFVSLQNLNFYAIAAVGKSKSLFKWSFYKWGFLLSALLIGTNFGMTGILWGMVLSSANIYFTNAFLAQIHTGLSFKNQILNVFPIAAIIGICYGIGFLGIYYTKHVIFFSFLSLFGYFVLARLLKIQAFYDTKLTILKILKKTSVL